MRLDILSENLKWLRIKKKLKMEAVEAETGISQSQLSRIKSRKIMHISSDILNLMTEGKR